MSNLLVVFGATGQQGGSVIDFVLNDKELRSLYKIRGITRNPGGAGGKALEAKGVEAVQGDAEQPETLRAAVKGGHTVFSNTATVYDQNLYERELTSGKAIADACVAEGVQYLIYSSSTPGGSFTGRPVVIFDCKYEVEKYIRTLPIKSAFYTPGTFMSNYLGQQKPNPTGEPGVFAISNIIAPDVQLPTIDIVGDTGKYIGAILADPAKYEGKALYATSEMLTLPEIADRLTKSSGQTVKYVHLPEETWKQYLPAAMQELLGSTMAYMNNPGYYGPDTKERVAWSQAQARGKLTTMEEFLQKTPLNLGEVGFSPLNSQTCL